MDIFNKKLLSAVLLAGLTSSAMLSGAEKCSQAFCAAQKRYADEEDLSIAKRTRSKDHLDLRIKKLLDERAKLIILRRKVAWLREKAFLEREGLCQRWLLFAKDYLQCNQQSEQDEYSYSYYSGSDSDLPSAGIWGIEEPLFGGALMTEGHVMIDRHE